MGLMRFYAPLVLVAAGAFIAPTVHAASASAIPSCYPQIRMQAKAPTTEVFVLIDQTTPLDMPLQQMVASNLANFLKPSDAFSVLQFSSFGQGKYTQLLTSVALDGELPITERNAVNKSMLNQFDACMRQQPRQASQLAGQALQTAFAGTSKEMAKSDILSSLKEISSAVRQSAAPRRIVIMASDMLENSSITSFYASNAVRKIDPAKEMAAAESARAFGDFGGAKVYVVGAGLLSDAAKAKSYRDPKAMTALSDFWRAWFAKSNAELIEFGAPALLNPVR